MTLKQVCEEYYNIVYRRCLRDLFYNQELASEVTQQPFLSCVRNGHPSATTRTWKAGSLSLLSIKSKRQKNCIQKIRTPSVPKMRILSNLQTKTRFSNR